MSPAISICMPNYNGAKFLKEAIDSALSQTYSDFELIIVDDCSTDDSIEIIQSYNDPRITFFQNPKNIHTSGTINRAINLAGGKIITILHSDDKYEPNFLEEIVKTAELYPEQKVFVTGVYFYHSYANSIKPWHPYDSEGIRTRKEIITRLFLGNNIGNGINVAIRRECFDEVGFFSEKYKYLADDDYWWRLGERYDFVYIPKILTYYRIHESNTTHSIIKDIIFHKEGQAVQRKNASQTKLISPKDRKELNYLERKQLIRKAFNYATKYKSGHVAREVLRYSFGENPSIGLEPAFYFIYLMSYFIHQNISNIMLKAIMFIGRVALYPNKIIIENILKKLINENTYMQSVTLQ